MRFAVFLRGVNVGTHNRVKMDALRAALEAAGLACVSTYLQSGNVIASGEDAGDVARRVAAALGLLKLDAGAFIRSGDDMRRIVAASPFGEDGSDDSHRFVTFLAEARTAELPQRSPKGDWEILIQSKLEVYTVARLVDARYGAPNGPLESRLRTPATTRNWAVVRAVAKLLGCDDE